jgi:hypothetical protein
MGRPPIGKKPMTPTEYQRRWRQRKRQAQAEPPLEAGPESPPPPAQVAADHRLIEALKARIVELTTQFDKLSQEPELDRRERDEARQERDEARRECDEARRERDAARAERDNALKGIVPKFKKVDDQVRLSYCMFCRRGQDKVDMIVAKDLELRLGICFNCIERCNKIVAEGKAEGRID